MIFLVVYCGLEILALAQTRHAGGVAFLWLASGFQIAALLHAGRKHWPALLGLSLLGSILALGLSGAALALAAGMAVAHAGEGLIAALLLRRPRSGEEEGFRPPAAYFAAIAIAAPAAGALWVASLTQLALGWPLLDNLANYFLAHAVGNIIFVPFFGLIVGGELLGRVRRQSARRRLELQAVSAVVVAVSAAAFWQTAFPLYFLPILAVMIAAYRFDRLGAALSVVLLAIVACGMTLVEAGPIAAVTDTAGSNAEFLQFYLAVTALGSQLLARAIAQRNRLKLAFQESEALYRLLAENTTDIILKTDRQGIILYASPTIGQLGFHPGDLIERSVLDLAQPAYADALKSELEAAIGKRQEPKRVEFLALPKDDGEEGWFEAQMHGIVDEHGEVHGAVSILRNIEERKALEEQLFAANLTDPLTHLTNRSAFVSMLQHLVDTETDGCLALFDIDHFRYINLQHGHAVGDEILVIFADLMRTMVRADDIISRIDGERFAVLLPRTTPDQAEALCQRIVRTLSDTSRAVGNENLRITVSAGVSRIVGSLDDTMKTAELALVIAKAKGRDRLEMATRPRQPWAPGPKR